MAWDQAHVTSELADTLIAVWQGEPTVARVNALADQLRDVARMHRGRVFLYNVITEPTPIPSAEARDALRAQFESVRGQLLGASIVLEKIGVQGTLSRTVLNTLLTLSQRPFPMRVFPTRRDAAVWLSTLGCVPPPNALVQAADDLTEQLRAGPFAPIRSKAP